MRQIENKIQQPHGIKVIVPASQSSHANSKSRIKTQGCSRMGILSTLTSYTCYQLVLDTGKEGKA